MLALVQQKGWRVSILIYTYSWRDSKLPFVLKGILIVSYAFGVNSYGLHERKQAKIQFTKKVLLPHILLTQVNSIQPSVTNILFFAISVIISIAESLLSLNLESICIQFVVYRLHLSWILPSSKLEFKLELDWLFY